MKKTGVITRDQYAKFIEITTRWIDNDVYGHVNNVVYYSFFDTAVNQLIIEADLLDPHHGHVIGLVVETQCHYMRALAFPGRVHAGVRVKHIGNSSVRYEIGLFDDSDETAAAAGHFVHVYVDRERRRPISIPENLRKFLAELRVDPSN